MYIYLGILLSFLASPLWANCAYDASRLAITAIQGGFVATYRYEESDQAAPIGGIEYKPVDKTRFQITHLEVRAFQRHGIGSSLVDFLNRELRKTAGPNASLEVVIEAPPNDAGFVRFLAANDFVPNGSPGLFKKVMRNGSWITPTEFEVEAMENAAVKIETPETKDARRPKSRQQPLQDEFEDPTDRVFGLFVALIHSKGRHTHASKLGLVEEFLQSAEFAHTIQASHIKYNDFYWLMVGWLHNHMEILPEGIRIPSRSQFEGAQYLQIAPVEHRGTLEGHDERRIESAANRIHGKWSTFLGKNYFKSKVLAELVVRHSLSYEEFYRIMLRFFIVHRFNLPPGARIPSEEDFEWLRSSFP